MTPSRFLSLSLSLSLTFACAYNVTPPALTACQTACSTLASKPHLDVYYHVNDTNFEVWDAKQQEVQSACRAVPTSSSDVAEIMAVLTANWCRFAVKGGGHARNADDSVSVGGVTVDMVRMKSIELSDDRTHARLGSGHVLYTLYSGLEEHNLSTTGGRVADVGLGGYALGGGISNFSPKYGLAVDNVFEYEVVLANATVAIVNENSHADLYFALRGGMNNFGIVTYFTMRIFPQGQLFSGSVRFSGEARNSVVQEAYKLTTEWKNDTDMSFSYGYAYSQNTDSFDISVTEAYAQPVLDPAPFRALNSLQHGPSTLRVDWMSNFSLEGASARPPGGRNMYATLSYYPSVDLDKAFQDIFAEEIQAVKNATGFSPNLIFQPLPEAAIREGRARGGSALGLEASGPLTMSLLTVQWKHSHDDLRMYEFAQKWIDRAKLASVEADKAHRWMYINYANQVQDPFAGYGEKNHKRLVEIEKQVDPLSVFESRGLCRGYFKLL